MFLFSRELFVSRGSLSPSVLLFVPEACTDRQLCGAARMTHSPAAEPRLDLADWNSASRSDVGATAEALPEPCCW